MFSAKRSIWTTALALLFLAAPTLATAQSQTVGLNGTMDVQAALNITVAQDIVWPTTAADVGAKVDNAQAGIWDVQITTGSSIEIDHTFPTGLTDGNGNSIPLDYSGIEDVAAMNICDDGSGGVQKKLYGSTTNPGGIELSCDVGDPAGANRRLLLGSSTEGQPIAADLQNSVPPGTYSTTFDVTITVL